MALRREFLHFGMRRFTFHLGVVNLIRLLKVSFTIQVEPSSRFRDDSERSAVCSDQQEMDQKKSISFIPEQYLAQTPCVGHRMDYPALPQEKKRSFDVYAATDRGRFANKQADNGTGVQRESLE